MFINLRNPRLQGPPSRPKNPAPAQAPEPAPDVSEKAADKKEKGRNYKKLAFQTGLAANSLAGVMKPAQAAAMDYEMVQVVEAASPQSITAADLAMNPAAFQRDQESFVRRQFQSAEAKQSLEYFDEHGRLFHEKFGPDKDLTPDQAVARLMEGKPEAVSIKLADGSVYKLKTPDELQEFDTFLGLGLNPAESPLVVDALKGLTQTGESDDGLIRDGASITGEKHVNAYQAYNALREPPPSATGATWKGAGKGALIGGGALGLAALGGAVLFPTAAPAFVSGGAMIAGGAAVLAVPAGIGAAAAYVGHKNSHPEELEVRRGLDRGLMVRNLDHAVETYEWLEARAANPFTEDQQRRAALNLAGASGLYRRGKEVTAERALELLGDGKAITVPSSIEGHSDKLNNLRDLQTLDTVRGLGINPVLSMEVSQSLRHLESGQNPADGLYKKGEFAAKNRLSAFEAVDYLFRERESISVKLNAKEYRTDTLLDIQELNALQGQGVNTILPAEQFNSLRMFDQRERLSMELTEEGPGAALDAYEALQEVQAGRPVRVESEGRLARIRELADFHELNSLEFSKRNEILNDRDYLLLNFWQGNGGYRVDNDGQQDRAYEALQSVQGGKEFEIRSEGRYAPAQVFQDLEDLATFEAPDAGFDNNVPQEDFDRLVHFQSKHGNNTTRVGNRVGRAYEGYRELRDGYSFDVNAAGVWNQVTSPQALHDLDALFGRQVNDILPERQYELIKHLGDTSENEGLQDGDTKLNSYGALQLFRQGLPVNYDFNGGDFGYRLSIPTPNLESLENTNELRENQREYDKYAYTVDEWRDKMQRQARHTPDLADSNLSYGRGKLRDGEAKLRRGESDLADAEGDLRRGKSDLRSAESDLSRARSLPTHIDKWETECDSQGNCTEVKTSEVNYERSRKISQAESRKRSAESDIRRARSDIRSAESLISQANSDISRARRLIRDARYILDNLGGYESLLNATGDGEFARNVGVLKGDLAEFERRSHISRLDANIDRQQRLISNMETRPARPEGWEVPDRLVQS